MKNQLLRVLQAREAAEHLVGLSPAIDGVGTRALGEAGDQLLNLIVAHGRQGVRARNAIARHLPRVAHLLAIVARVVIAPVNRLVGALEEADNCVHRRRASVGREEVPRLIRGHHPGCARHYVGHC